MSLDPVLQEFLAQANSQPGPKLWEMDAAGARALFAQTMQLFAPKNVDCGAIAHLSALGRFGSDTVKVLYTSDSSRGHIAAAVYFHGGGFVIGDLDTVDGVCRLLANESGARIISVDYRLAPEHKFPAAVEDCYDAVVWIARNADKLGIDAHRIAVGGDSAGGNLAAVVTQLARDDGGPALVFQVLLFPVTQIGADTISMHACGEGYFLERAALDWFYRSYLAREAEKNDPRVSPLLAGNLRGLPPALVMTAGHDPLHDEGVQYLERLRDSGVVATHKEYASLVHDFIFLYAVLPQAHEAIGAIASMLRETFATQ